MILFLRLANVFFHSYVETRQGLEKKIFFFTVTQMYTEINTYIACFLSKYHTRHYFIHIIKSRDYYYSWQFTKFVYKALCFRLEIKLKIKNKIFFLHFDI